MTGTFTDSPGAPAPAGARRRTTGAERAFVLGGLGLAALYTAASLILGAGAEAIGPLWMAAIGWTVAGEPSRTSLWLGLRHHGDWSAFAPIRSFPRTTRRRDRRVVHPHGQLFVSQATWEDELLHDDDHLR